MGEITSIVFVILCCSETSHRSYAHKGRGPHTNMSTGEDDGEPPWSVSAKVSLQKNFLFNGA